MFGYIAGMHQTFQNRVNSEMNYLLIWFFFWTMARTSRDSIHVLKKIVQSIFAESQAGLYSTRMYVPYSARFGDLVFYGDYLLDVVAWSDTVWLDE